MGINPVTILSAPTPIDLSMGVGAGFLYRRGSMIMHSRIHLFCELLNSACD